MSTFAEVKKRGLNPDPYGHGARAGNRSNPQGKGFAMLDAVLALIGCGAFAALGVFVVDTSHRLNLRTDP
jgi:hypothetical protein